MNHFRIIICLLCFGFISLTDAEFNRTSGLIDIPGPDILPKSGFCFGYDGSFSLGTDPINDRYDHNFHLSFGLFKRLESYLDIYSFSNFSAVLGCCCNFFNSDKFGIATGIHQLSWSLNISELGNGDSVGWTDDLSYNRGEYKKPFELFSLFLTSRYSITPRVKAIIGFGRGRYVGYGTHSQYFNTNFYHEKGGDWAIGLFAGMEFNLTRNIAFIFEGDSRDLNFGFDLYFAPVDIGLAITKFEYFVWPDGAYEPRFAFSISYKKLPEKPKLGRIAGTVFDESDNPIIAELSIIGTDIPKILTSPDQGSYIFSDIKPGHYRLYATAPGYIGQYKEVDVITSKITFCDFTLKKQAPETGGIIGKVVDMKTNEPLIVTLSIPRLGISIRSDSTGIFEFKKLPPGDYKVKAEAIDYETGVYPVVVRPGERTSLDIRMVKKGMVITLRGVKFDFNKATLRPESYPVLDEAAAILTNHPEIVVEIQGHTDAIGSASYNLKLSNARANTVRDYLITKHMINPSRLIARGYGESRPIADNRTIEGRAKNRRVDFVILK
ncbi:hypothetical protein BXT86_03765 [candidate division WOR-3 bacterium 4484_100]|uniref:OmpA-like domain-containing protein n=1 Tax=candidate division WOR-3 bacterium 4484_100 TaxID=1936077 RepID=A0A1V4QGG2_UNCW3|nr:MAG: hypothetical protein BXT86_03765 [candidate division WOR-3 bacterium 4484_100]